MGEGWGEKSLEELGANKPRGHEVAGGGIHVPAHSSPTPRVKAMPVWGCEDGWRGSCIQRRGGDWKYGWRVMQLNSCPERKLDITTALSSNNKS